MNHDSHEPYRSAPDPRDPGGAEPPAARRRPGLAWERRAELGPGVALLRTIREVVFSPAVAFADMHLTGGWAEPLGFAVLLGSISIWVAQAWDMLARSLMAGLPGFDLQEIAAANIEELGFALAAPLLVIASTFFAAAVVHLLLMMFGGAPQPYEATFRVISYSWAVGVFNLIPICGVFIGALWRIVVQVLGLREAHGVPTGRAAAAVLLPVILACFCAVLLLIAAVSVAGLAQMGVP